MKHFTALWLLAALLTLIPLTLSAADANGTNAFSISRSSADGIQLHFELPAWKLEDVKQGERTLQRVSIADAPYIYIDETETLPVFATMVAIPYSGGASLNVLGSQQQNRNVVNLDFDSILANERATGKYTDALYPASSALISEPQVIRDFRVITVNIYPFQYDQQTGQLIVKQSMDLRIDFTTDPAWGDVTPPTAYSQAFEPIYKGLIINYEAAINRTLSFASPKMLVIYGNFSDPIYLAKVNEYVNWKKQKGFIVNSVSTATTGTTNTAIKAYIQTQYNSVNTRPDYIVLIGDSGSGSMQVPTYGTYTDYYYTWLAGTDNLGDVIIGRISVENTDQMINYMAKVASLEQNLNLNTASWLNKMVLVGDTAHSGISTIYTSEYIEDIASAVNPAYTYTEEFSGSPSNANVNTAINIQGVAFYNYRGYIGMSGWPSYISQLSNQFKLFHAVIITCATGNFSSGTATTETVVRQGTAAGLGGSITAIGMATSSTATPQNNCLDVGIFHSIYSLGARDMGTAMLYGKLYLNAVYGTSAPTEAANFAAYCNLIGDPTAEVYVGIPSTFNVSAPAAIPAGASNVEITVKNASNEIISGASVSLTNADGLQVLGFSDAQGKVLLSLSPALADSLTLTVDKNDFKPAVSTIYITSTGGIVYSGTTIDDGDNGVINSGEAIELYVSLKNTTATTQSLTASVTCQDPYINLTQYDHIEFNPILAMGTGANFTPIIFEVAPNCPDQHSATLVMSVESNGVFYTVNVPITVRSGKLDIQAYTFVGATANTINPGDQYPFTINVVNNGAMNLNGINARLRSHDLFFSIRDSLGVYGNINQSASSTNSGDTFTVYARGICIKGMTIPLSLYLYNGDGFEQTIDFNLTIGQPGLNDPLGQDAYGYFILDDGDTTYSQCPTYVWIGIAPAEGGTGTALSLTDPGSGNDEGDQVGAVSIQTVSLPFAFKYYGVDYTQASISANGFIAFGQTVNSDWRNWRMPDAGGPNAMIAAFWDDLEFGSGSAVYTYYNPTQHFYVVEWYNLISGYNSSSLETFQAILYDPIYYPTHTGDGQVKLQYKVINNVDLGASEDHFPHGNFATVGIEDHTGTVGLEYTYNSAYPTQAKTLSNEMALLITTRPILPDYPYIAIDQVNVLDTNANQHLEPGETASLAIILGNRGLVNATNVAATLSSSDPYVTISSNYYFFGSIAAQENVTSQTNYTIAVSSACPANHALNFTLSVTCATGSWTYYFSKSVYAPSLNFSNHTLSETVGDNNGILDPGETAFVTIRINNSGEVSSSAGSATLTCATPGITINSGSDTFPILTAGSYDVLSFSISAASSMTDGTLIQLNYAATAGTSSASIVEYVEVGAPLVVDIGTGTNAQTYPLDRYYNYSTHEAIYLASEIGMAGSLKSIGFYKASGSDVNSIQSVTIYIKNTTASTLATGVYSTTGYTQVYNGSFTNNAASGWMEVNLNPMFVYDGVSNLSILTVKGHEAYISNYPQWNYSNSTSRARQNRNDSAAPTSLTVSNNLPNLRLRVFPNANILLPPQTVDASASHQSVLLTWTVPAAGTPNSYKIFRNSALLTTVTGLTYTDTAVTDGQSYEYYLKAVYAGVDSEPSMVVTATPNTVPPTNLIVVEGNTVANLSWTGATGRNGLELFSKGSRAISNYRIYRNGTAIATAAGNTYQDTGLTNGTAYTYYVTTVYTNPAGESAASNSVTVTPGEYTFVTIGSGTATEAYPIDRYYNYSAHEAIYLASEIGMAGTLKALSFYKASGADVNPIGAVSIYMKATSDAVLSDGAYSTAGYTLVYSGSFPNDAASGWMEANLNPQFVYDGSANLSILIVKGFEQWTSNYPYWTYTSAATSRVRRERNDNSAPSLLTASTNLPNIRFKVQELVTLLPPVNLSASVSHQSVKLTWEAPLSGTPTGYKILRNSALLTTVSQLTYTDVAVTNGTTYAYSLKAVYSGGESDATNPVNATPNAIAPTNLTATPGNAIVELSWMPVTGRADREIAKSGDRAISSYRIYRNGTAVTTTTGNTYQDTGLTNGLTYSYYVTTVYTNPAGESAASNTASATLSNISYAIIGTGTSVSTGSQNSPINICNNSTHGQSVYTAAALNAAGITGPIQITGLGFNVITAPNLALPNFVVRMAHTTATNAAAWIPATGLLTTYSNASYLPTAGGYDMLTFSTPFFWNGTDNILVDTAFSLVTTRSNTGTLQYTSVTSGYRFAYSNTANQSNVFTGGLVVVRMPNIRLALQPVQSPVVQISTASNGFNLSWIAVPFATQYKILSATEPDGTYTILTTQTGLSYTDLRGLPKAFYKVQAIY